MWFYIVFVLNPIIIVCVWERGDVIEIEMLPSRVGGHVSADQKITLVKIKLTSD